MIALIRKCILFLIIQKSLTVTINTLILMYFSYNVERD